jgi:hypothetical protein
MNGGFTNTDTGTVLADGSVIRFSSALTNSAGGRINITNGTAYFNSAFSNQGQVSLAAGTAYFNGGLANAGQMLVTFGGGTVFGAVTTNSGGAIILSGNSNTTFYDAVDVQSGGELRVSAGSAAVFFGQVFQRTGSIFNGTGTKFYEGGLAVGGSPGLGLDGGDVNFGAGNVFTVDIGGSTACTADCATDDARKNSSFDKYIVAGHLSLGGTLKLASWDGFTAHAGQTFDLLDWGSVDGHFDSIDTSGLLLPDGTALDTSRLAIDGSFSVVAVPEPAGWALMLAGLGLGGWMQCRRARARHSRTTPAA